MDLWDLFRGYAFFKLVSAGIGFILAGVVITFPVIFDGAFELLICNIPLLLIGAGILYFARGIWKEEKRRDEYTSGAGRDNRTTEYLMTCPKCGKESMDVDIDGSGYCKNCGHSVQEYYKKMENE